MFLRPSGVASLRHTVHTMTTTLPPLTATPFATAPAPQGWPLFRLGFRPFYLGAAAFGMLVVPLWVAMLLGQVSLNLNVSPVLWH